MHRNAPIHRFIAWLSLVGYGLVASGLPLPLGAVAPGGASPAAEKRLAAKDRSTPFPCMDKPCGCVTAEQCFTNCCCNTPAETLAWSAAHHVDPAVIAALQRRVAAPPEKTVAASSCRSAKQQATCCSAPSEPACCSETAAGEETVSPDVEPVSSHTVVLKAMLACGGIVSQWLSVGGAPPPPVVVAVVSVTPLVEAILPGDAVFSCVRAAPDAPPPRVA
jgi:hypothetical protein